MATFYIATTGNDTTGDGSSALPWLTISKAHTEASGDDTIICQDGTYTWLDQTFSKNLTIEADNVGLAIFDAESTNPTWIINSSVTMNFNGLVFINHVGTEPKGAFQVNEAATPNQPTVSFTNCTVHDVDIDCDPGGSRGGFIAGNGTVVSNKRIDLSLTSCSFYNIRKVSGGSHGAIFARRGMVGSVIVVNNCSFYYSETGATAPDNIFNFIISNATISISFKNNIFQSSGDSLDVVEDNPLTISYDYCCVDNMVAPTTGTGNLDTDPLFIEPSNGNLKLRQNSPCIDTGTLI